MTLFTSQEKEKIYALKHSGLFNLTHNMPAAVKDIFKANHDCVALAGGCFASMFHSEKIKDFDFFVLNVGDAHKRVSDMIGGKFVSFGLTEEGDTRYTNNPSVLRIVNLPTFQVQFIFSNHKNLKELFNDFDFKHAKAALMMVGAPGNAHLIISKNTYNCIRDKKLVWNKDPSTIAHSKRDYRIKKFVDRGWDATAVSV